MTNEELQRMPAVSAPIRSAASAQLPKAALIRPGHVSTREGAWLAIGEWKWRRVDLLF